MSNTSKVLSFEEGWLASKARKRLGLTLGSHSMVNYGCNTIDGLHNAHLTTIPTAARTTLMLLDGVIGRELPRIGTVPNKRKPGSVEQANSVAPPRPTEHAMLEAAIQLGREPINLPSGRLVRVRYAPIATKFDGAVK